MIFTMTILFRGFPGGLDSKESACNAGDPGSIPGWGRSPGGENGNPLHYCLENPTDRGAWQATVHGVSKRVGHDWATDTCTDDTSGRMVTPLLVGYVKTIPKLPLVLWGKKDFTVWFFVLIVLSKLRKFLFISCCKWTMLAVNWIHFFPWYVLCVIAFFEC